MQNTLMHQIFQFQTQVASIWRKIRQQGMQKKRTIPSVLLESLRGKQLYYIHIQYYTKYYTTLHNYTQYDL